MNFISSLEKLVAVILKLVLVSMIANQSDVTSGTFPIISEETVTSGMFFYDIRLFISFTYTHSSLRVTYTTAKMKLAIVLGESNQGVRERGHGSNDLIIIQFQ